MAPDPAPSSAAKRLEALLDHGWVGQAPSPRVVELHLSGANPQRWLVDLEAGDVRERGQMAVPLTVEIPRALFEDLVHQGPDAWFAAWDKGVVQLHGDPTKVEMLEVFVERVLRPAAGAR